ncbi:hypothetical protein EDD95_0668 [Streptomyces sp. CEV 2-1]|nr:hypothetical protein EDD95_0668 [Streptomyces sp. CEV 2-1]
MTPLPAVPISEIGGGTRSKHQRDAHPQIARGDRECLATGLAVEEASMPADRIRHL